MGSKLQPEITLQGKLIQFVFDLDAEDKYSSKERAMSIFKTMDTSDDTYKLVSNTVICFQHTDQRIVCVMP